MTNQVGKVLMSIDTWTKKDVCVCMCCAIRMNNNVTCFVIWVICMDKEATSSRRQPYCIYETMLNSNNWSLITIEIVYSCMLCFHDPRYENYESIKQSIIYVLGSDQYRFCFQCWFVLESRLWKTLMKQQFPCGSLIMWGDALEFVCGSLNSVYKAMSYALTVKRECYEESTF